MTPTNTRSQGGAHGIYVASRASIPERPMMWQGLRLKGWPIVSTWIDEAGEGETGDFTELWQRIHDEIASSVGVLLYAEVGDFPLKGALIECGIALGMGKPVAVVLPSVRLEPRSMKPIGSWAAHPNVQSFDDLATAKDWLLAAPASAQEAALPSAQTADIVAASMREHGVVLTASGYYWASKLYEQGVAAGRSTPSAAVQQGEAPHDPEPTYTTQPGESLMGIAFRELGSEHRWKEIRNMNADQFGMLAPHEYYPVGSVLRMPADYHKGRAALASAQPKTAEHG